MTTKFLALISVIGLASICVVQTASRPALITPSDASDHYPVTCDFTIKGENASAPGQTYR